jgi:phage terminase small subunit
MGWLKRVLGLDSDGDAGSEVIAEETVDILKLPDWIDQKANRSFDRIKPGIEEQFRKILEEKKSLLDNLEELRDAELQNPNISEREKSIMEGNRASYISQHRQFLNMVEVSNALTCKEVSLFCKNFEELLQRLASSTAKGHLVMNEFFAEHAGRINRNVKVMKDAVIKIETILDGGNLKIDSLDEMRVMVADIKAKLKLLSEIDEELKVHEKKLANSRQLKSKLEKSVEQLKKQDSYLEFQDADNERDNLWKSVKKIEDDISGMFSPLDRPMRKFERMLLEDTKLFTGYIESPVAALMEDADLRILPIMERMKTAIDDGKLELKDKELEKAVQRIEQVQRERLLELRSKHAEHKKAIKKIDDEMRNNNVMQDLSDLHYKIEHADSQIKLLQDRIENAKKTRDKTDVEAMKQELRQCIIDTFMVEVDITWQDSRLAS